MNFNDLLQYPIERESYDFLQLIGYTYNHVPEIDQYDFMGGIDYNAIGEQRRIKIHFLKDHCFDGRRVWQLYYVTIDDNLVMFCSNAGREGDDHYSRRIFDKDSYLELVKYMKSFCKDGEQEIGDLTDLEDDASGFYEFYGNRLDGYFDRY